MDLYSLRESDASYNPFTNLAGFRPFVGERRLALSIPVLEYPDTASYSTLFHELTHLWCVRTSRLGAMLAIASARAFAAWRAGNPPAIERRAYRLLGAPPPVLEGMALYADLDYQGNEDRDPIHSPLLKISHYTALGMKGVEGDAQFFGVRQARLYDGGYLEALFLAPAIAPTEHAYLSGYLCVKSVAAYLRALCPEAAHPSFLLPLLIRLFCDHPYIVKSQLEDVAPAEILAAIQKSIFSLRRETIKRLFEWVRDKPGEVVEQFEQAPRSRMCTRPSTPR